MANVSSNVHDVTRVEIASMKVERSDPNDAPFYTIKVRVFITGEDTVPTVEHTLIGGSTAIPLTFAPE